MSVTVLWMGGETEIEGDYLSVRDVLDRMNRLHPDAKYFMARNEKGELLKPSLELTNKQRIVVIQKPEYAEER